MHEPLYVAAHKVAVGFFVTALQVGNHALVRRIECAAAAQRNFVRFIAGSVQNSLEIFGADFFDAKGDVEALFAPGKPVFEPASHPAMHPGRCARVLLDGAAVGYVGELHPQWRQAYGLAVAPLLFELELDALVARRVPSFEAVPKFQAVQRDIAVRVADSVTHAALMACIQSANGSGLLRHAELFDVYRPPAGPDTDRSLAVRLTLNSADATLTEEQIDAAVKSVVDQLASQLGARQRV